MGSASCTCTLSDNIPLNKDFTFGNNAVRPILIVKETPLPNFIYSMIPNCESNIQSLKKKLNEESDEERKKILKHIMNNTLSILSKELKVYENKKLEKISQLINLKFKTLFCIYFSTSREIKKDQFSSSIITLLEVYHLICFIISKDKCFNEDKWWLPKNEFDYLEEKILGIDSWMKERDRNSILDSPYMKKRKVFGKNKLKIANSNFLISKKDKEENSLNGVKHKSSFEIEKTTSKFKTGAKKSSMKDLTPNFKIEESKSPFNINSILPQKTVDVNKDHKVSYKAKPPRYKERTSLDINLLSDRSDNNYSSKDEFLYLEKLKPESFEGIYRKKSQNSSFSDSNIKLYDDISEKQQSVNLRGKGEKTIILKIESNFGENK